MEENEQTIDLKDLLNVFKRHFLPIIAAALAAALVGFILATVIIPKKYTSDAMMYVENSADKSSDAALNINDINAAQKIVNTCQILFTSNHVLEELRADFGDFTVKELENMIKIESVNNTEILKIAVTSLNPQTSTDIATRLVELSQDEFHRVIKNGSIEVVSSPTLPETHTFPSTTVFTLVGLFIGLIVSYIAFLIVEMVDVKVKPADDLMQIYGIPVFAEIMDFEASDKSSYKYNYYSSGSTGSPDKARPVQPLKKPAPDKNLPAAKKNNDNRKEKT